MVLLPLVCVQLEQFFILVVQRTVLILGDPFPWKPQNKHGVFMISLLGCPKSHCLDLKGRGGHSGLIVKGLFV